MGEPAVGRCRSGRTWGSRARRPSRSGSTSLMRELERTGAFDRSWLMIASPTGTGYVNYAAVSILEFLTRGDCATVAMQYAARPSPLSLDRVDEGRLHMQLLVCGDPRSPRAVPARHGARRWCCSARASARGRARTRSSTRARRASSTPASTTRSGSALRTSASGRSACSSTIVPTWTAASSACSTTSASWEALDPATRERLRFVMITHYDDGVGAFGPELAIQAPEWLGDPQTRHATVPKGMRWMPTTTFFQVLVDMKNAANVVPGVFAAKGHDYRADLLPFFNAVLGLDATPEQLANVGAWLEEREGLQSQWMKAHGTVDKGLAATVLQRLDAGGARRRAQPRRTDCSRSSARWRSRSSESTSGIARPGRLPPSVIAGRRPRPFAIELAAVGVGRALQRDLPPAYRAPGPARDQRDRGRRARRPRPRRRPRARRPRARAGSAPPRRPRAGLAAALPVDRRVWGSRSPSRRPARLLADEKITGTGRAEAAFETFVRIPLETALAEEIIFRGVLLGLGLRSRTPVGAVVSSSIWFGLWHVYPTLGSLGRGGGGDLVGDRAAPCGRGDRRSGRGDRRRRSAVSRRFGYGRGASPRPVIAHAALNMAAFAGVRLTKGR